MSKQLHFITPRITRNRLKIMQQANQSSITSTSQFDDISTMNCDSEMFQSDNYTIPSSDTEIKFNFKNFQRQGIKNKIIKKKLFKFEQKQKSTNNTSIKNVIKPRNFDFNILRFQNQTKNKTYRIYCFKEDDLNIPEKFQKMTIQHKSDNDKQSDDECIKNAQILIQDQLIKAIQQQNE